MRCDEMELEFYIFKHRITEKKRKKTKKNENNQLVNISHLRKPSHFVLCALSWCVLLLCAVCVWLVRLTFSVVFVYLHTIASYSFKQSTNLVQAFCENGNISFMALLASPWPEKSIAMPNGKWLALLFLENGYPHRKWWFHILFFFFGPDS